jgi:2-phosphosulfolactate phosphatase
MGCGWTQRRGCGSGDTLNPAHRQSSYRLRLDWGAAGAAATGQDVDVAVVVDVLSFTTTVTVAAEQGIAVLPYRWGSEGAAELAEQRDATLAVGRSEVRASGGVSLSPVGWRGLSGVDRVVLPSPNGAAVAAALANSGATVLAASLRNASSVAHWLAPRIADGAVVAVIASGERWPDGTLRPAVEDLWGAGAVLADLVVSLPAVASPEAELAVHAFGGVRDSVADRLAACASGRELIAGGYAEDVAMAGDLDSTEVVPVLTDGAFEAAPG